MDASAKSGADKHDAKSKDKKDSSSSASAPLHSSSSTPKSGDWAARGRRRTAARKKFRRRQGGNAIGAAGVSAACPPHDTLLRSSRSPPSRCSPCPGRRSSTSSRAPSSKVADRRPDLRPRASRPARSSTSASRPAGLSALIASSPTGVQRAALQRRGAYLLWLGVQRAAPPPRRRLAGAAAAAASRAQALPRRRARRPAQPRDRTVLPGLPAELRRARPRAGRAAGRGARASCFVALGDAHRRRLRDGDGADQPRSCGAAERRG